jgi:hypothetical protein
MAEIIVFFALFGTSFYLVMAIMITLRFWSDRQTLKGMTTRKEQEELGMYHYVWVQYLYAFFAWPHLLFKVYLQ